MRTREWMRRVLILLSTAFLLATTPQPQAETTLTEVLVKTGATPEKFMLHHGSRMAKPVSRKSLPRRVENLARDFGLGKMHATPVAEGLRWTAEGTWGRNLKVECNVIVDKPEDTYVQPYLSIQIKGSGRPGKGLIVARDHMVQLLRQYHIQPRTHFSIQGIVSKPTDSYGQKDETIQQVLQQLRARKVESMDTYRTISVSAYTPLFSGGLVTKGGKMNVQAAAKVATDERHLVLTLGTPIITIEY
ncbi:TATA-box binding [Marininema mesophilum]|uniref:TATA-box binding n=1 Tax=Marininema mesophilum TaxID=1048340 RepID=A0A1H2TDR0_9BACL|nr:YwmB family TATA-box binding protein [Marininema mesophilum]SDW42103.1 TATA-box binding [Marininema mesophilum]